jgi:AcrR family transcriptional regulator
MGRQARNGNTTDPRVRVAVLRSAAELFNSKGYAATTVREIVEAAGVTKPVLYYYFGNKEGVFLELLNSPVERLRALLHECEKGEGMASERVLAMFDRMFVLFCENMQAARLIFSIYYGPSQGAPSVDLEWYHKEIMRTLHRLVEEGVKSGEWCGDNIEEFIWAILGAFVITVEIQLSHPELAVGREGLSHILNLIFRGMAVPGKERT